MGCPACGHDVVEGSQFCPSCGARVDSSAAATQTVAAIESHLHTGALDGAQFAPGTLLNGRYRIVGLIGRGGMGEVYRADDLTLSQPVALKFLPKRVAYRPEQLERFRGEVRLARQISHPNVCRVHDIAEAAGQVFLSMEYIDGEDLASLLRRIGHLPQNKALDIARQLCAGLAAAHARKVLHRDLKPANVLIDSRGQAHLADFGLADFVGRRRGIAEVAGTPGYMAPEQLDGRDLTTRTDLYALGLVMYEMFTGRRAFSADSGSSDRFRRWTPPVSPSTHVPDLDPAIDRIILRCLESDPARRPASAVAVAAALPGGNALAAMIAAGETPSPETVAAAGEPGTLTPTVAALCLGGVLAGLIALSFTLRDVSLIGLTNPERTPQALTERAHNVLRSLGYLDPPADEAIGFTADIDYLRHIDEHDQSPTRWRQIGDARPPALLFWYRQGSRRLDPIGGATIVTRVNPPETQSGMLSLLLDRSGRLVSLLAVPVSNSDPDRARVACRDRLESSIQRSRPADRAVLLGYAAVDSTDLRRRSGRMDRRVSRTPRRSDHNRGGVAGGSTYVLRNLRALDAAAQRRRPTWHHVGRTGRSADSNCRQPPRARSCSGARSEKSAPRSWRSPWRNARGLVRGRGRNGERRARIGESRRAQ
jgi:serine/threonine-protein kinase